MKKQQQFYRSSTLPWLEIRHAADTQSCFIPHTHQTHSIGCLLEGHSWFHYQNKKLASQPDELCLINADELHACQPRSDNGWRYLMLYLDKHWLANRFAEGAESTSSLNFSKPQLKDQKLTQQFIRYGIQLSHDEQLTQETQLMELLGCILKQDKQSTLGEAKFDDSIANITAEYIRANFIHALTLDELAKLTCRSPWHLQKCFRKTFGVSPAHFQHQCRIHHACQLLRQGAAINQVALESGYTDQSHLHRWFKKLMGCTPGQYMLSQPIQLISA